MWTWYLKNLIQDDITVWSIFMAWISYEAETSQPYSTIGNIIVLFTCLQTFSDF